MKQELTKGEAKLFEIIKWVVLIPFIALMVVVGFTIIMVFLGWLNEVTQGVNLHSM